MKTQKLIVIVLALLTVSGFKANAQKVKDSNNIPVHQISIHVSTQNHVLLYADHLEKERSKYILKVYSEKGEMVYASSFFKKGSISTSFDLSELPQGKYEFIVYSKLKPVYRKEVMKRATSMDEFENESLVVELREYDK